MVLSIILCNISNSYAVDRISTLLDYVAITIKTYLDCNAENPLVVGDYVLSAPYV